MKNIAPLALDVIRTNIRVNGVIAATHSPGEKHKDYLHIWPRDSLFVALELMNFDMQSAKNIVEGIINLPHDNGLFYQRYEQDSQPDPHGWCNNDDSRQLDQDALKFVAISKFPNLNIDTEKVRKSYFELLKKIEDKRPSTDVWEQKTGYFFYTTACLIWGLKSAEKAIKNSRTRHKSILREIIKSLDSFYDKNLKSYVKSPSERITDLEVVLGLNVLFDSGHAFDTEGLLKAVSTLERLEDELCHTVCGIKIPIRYNGDFWDGENAYGNCRPWPMGCALISQAYSHIASRALEISEHDLSAKALKNAERWLNYVKSMPHIGQFPEQIDYDGSLPKSVPRPLTWYAAEAMKAERLYNLKASKKPLN